MMTEAELDELSAPREVPDGYGTLRYDETVHAYDKDHPAEDGEWPLPVCDRAMWPVTRELDADADRFDCIDCMGILG